MSLEHLSKIISGKRTERRRRRSGERTPGGEKGPLPLLRVQLSGVPPETLFGETPNNTREDAYAPQKLRRWQHFGNFL
jgi:hypothetical protein